METDDARCDALRWSGAEQVYYESEMAEMGEHATPNTRCALASGHAGAHRFETEVEMESWLPECLLCGGKAARCGCPKFDAHGRSTVRPVE